MAERVRVHQSRELGEYVEYREPWRRSFMVSTPWLLVGLYIAVEAALGHFVVGCIGKGVEQVCGAPAVEPTRDSYYLIAAVFLIVGGTFTFRSVFRHPCLRVGTLGFEDRALLVHRVAWHDVRLVERSKRDLLGRTVRITLNRRGRFWGWRSINIRVSGFSRPAAEIEAGIASKLERARGIPGS